MKYKLAIILSHPVQYYSPLFALAAKSIELKVFYGFQPDAEQQGKEGFGEAFEWDVNLFSGYQYEIVGNVSKNPSSAYFNGCDTPKLGEQLAAFGPTHVITIGWHLKMYRQALHYCKKNKIPIAVRGDSQLNPQLPLWKKIVKRLYYPFYLNKFDAFLSVGIRNRAYLRHFRVNDKRIIFSPHAIDQQFWTVERKSKKDTYQFIWVGKFIPKKRPLDAISAFKRILDNDPALIGKMELLMVGSGELLEESKREASNYNDIKFLGFKNQKQLKVEYGKVNCLLLTSDYGETWGLVVNEAFSIGIPAIISDGCGCSADLIDGQNGKTYELGNIKSLAKQMNSLARWKEEDVDQAQKGIRQKNQIYNFESIVGSFELFIKDF